MITYEELKTALIDISNISTQDMQQFADRGAHLVEEGYIDE